MSSYPNSRETCAYIQGKVVNIVPTNDPNYNDKYDSIYNHGYGEPAGTLGINCRHKLFPFTSGVNVNNMTQYNPKEAIRNGNLRQKQRYYERSIRDAKKRLKIAEELEDEQMITRTKTLISARQKKLREYIKETNKLYGKNHDILIRDYDREQITYKKKKLDQSNKTESQKHVEAKIKSGQWGTKINPEKQAPHMESTKLEGKSYLYDSEDPQELLDKYAGKGHINKNKKGLWDNGEVIEVDHIVGVDYNSGMKTRWIKIHHSKKRTHIVPIKPKDGDDNNAR
ncbi:phage minor capsid protein [Ligilactobacillus salivarius]|uniref:phage minor capsid protein n=1 Tax=Ligilactobacillus salivarius TaxID=1624 RepID=UPI00189E9575|nr:phage minor capsid protein [Ligilactobacillus salivarius]